METISHSKVYKEIAAVMIFMQLSRMVIEKVIFLFTERSRFSDDMVTMTAMIILAALFLIVCGKKGENLSIFPKRFGILYILESTVFVFLAAMTPIITGDISISSIMIIIYSSIVTPVFEEIIFRGFIWNRLNGIFNKEWISYILTTVLFGLWHFGYIDGIAFRIGTADLKTVMIWKVITGMCFGIILGAVRIKTKNCYSAILLHGIMNIFGR